MESSLFALEKSKISYKEVKSFCDQQIPEGLRIDYKEDFPKNEGLARTICAFANTAGGILLIGVKADKVRNVPVDVQGVQMTEGLEEKVVNICLSHILPRIVPDIKLCPFKSDDGSERAILFVRVESSYTAPHYLWQTKEVLVRVNNKDDRADLQTIEELVERRKRIRDQSTSGSFSPWWSTKLITVEDPVFETVVIMLPFAKENIVRFSKENDALLFDMANEVMNLEELIPYPNRIVLESKSAEGKTRRFCRVDGDGRVILQKVARIDNDRFMVFESFSFLTKALKTARKICGYLAFYGDVSVGLTVSNPMKLKLRLSFPEDRYLLDNFYCDDEWISVSRALRFDDLVVNPTATIQSMFSEFCRFFHFTTDSKLVAEIVEKSFLPLLK
jgi:hypothetical protein